MSHTRELDSPSSTISQAYSQLSPDSTKRISALLTRSKSMPQLISTTPYLYKAKDISQHREPIDGGGESLIFVGWSRDIVEEFVIKQIHCADTVDEKEKIKTSDYVMIKTKEECEIEKDLWIKLTEAKTRNILGFYGYFYTKACFSFIFARENQSLFTYIKNHNTPSWQLRYHLMIDITAGVVDTHANGVIHGDIKAPNILVNAKMKNAKICDLGSAHEETDIKKNSFTPEFAAAEVFEHHLTTKKSDIFSLAVTFWQIAAWKLIPYDGLPRIAIKLGVQDGHRLPLPKNIPVKIANLITWGWSQVPDSRPTAVEVLDKLKQISLAELIETDENQYRLCLDELAEKQANKLKY